MPTYAYIVSTLALYLGASVGTIGPQYRLYGYMDASLNPPVQLELAEPQALRPKLKTLLAALKMVSQPT